MRVVIVGAGTIGFHLASELAAEGHELVVIDRDEERLRYVSERLDVIAIHGHGASPATLKQAELERAEMVIAVTDSDELNMIVCLLARDSGVHRRIARVRNPEYAGAGADFARTRLGLDLVISPEDAAVNALTRLLLTPGATEVAEFDGGAFLLLGFDLAEDAPLVGRNVAEIRSQLGGEGFLIVSIARPAAPPA